MSRMYVSKWDIVKQKDMFILFSVQFLELPISRGGF